LAEYSLLFENDGADAIDQNTVLSEPPDRVGEGSGLFVLADRHQFFRGL
jgi:hypothetical protein